MGGWVGVGGGGRAIGGRGKGVEDGVGREREGSRDDSGGVQKAAGLSSVCPLR